MTSASASSVLSARFAGWALPTLLAAAAAVFAAVDAWLGRRRVAALRSECSKLRELRAAERAGRTAAERRLRHAQVFRPDLPASSPAWSATAPSPSPALCTYRPIGRIESCYAERRGTPRQGLLVPAARARLRLDPQVIQPTAALEGLDGFSHVWLIFDFHENTNACKAAAAVANTGGGASTVSSCGNGGGGASGSATGSNGGASSRKALSRPARPFPQVRAKVHPPGLLGGSIGLFATRTPHRPNPIGLSVAKLISVQGGTLLLGGADLLDGTPILDVKPYLLHDVHPTATVPKWCEARSDASAIHSVGFTPAAAAAVAAAADAGSLRFYQDGPSAQEAIAESLQLDIRSVFQGRGGGGGGGGEGGGIGHGGGGGGGTISGVGRGGTPVVGQHYSFRFDALTVDFETFEAHVLVTRCQLVAERGDAAVQR